MRHPSKTIVVLRMLGALALLAPGHVAGDESPVPSDTPVNTATATATAVGTPDLSDREAFNAQDRWLTELTLRANTPASLPRTLNELDALIGQLDGLAAAARSASEQAPGNAHLAAQLEALHTRIGAVRRAVVARRRELFPTAAEPVARTTSTTTLPGGGPPAAPPASTLTTIPAVPSTMGEIPQARLTAASPQELLAMLQEQRRLLAAHAAAGNIPGAEATRQTLEGNIRRIGERIQARIETDPDAARAFLELAQRTDSTGLFQNEAERLRILRDAFAAVRNDLHGAQDPARRDARAAEIDRMFASDPIAQAFLQMMPFLSRDRAVDMANRYRYIQQHYGEHSEQMADFWSQKVVAIHGEGGFVPRAATIAESLFRSPTVNSDTRRFAELAGRAFLLAGGQNPAAVYGAGTSTAPDFHRHFLAAYASRTEEARRWNADMASGNEATIRANWGPPVLGPAERDDHRRWSIWASGFATSRAAAVSNFAFQTGERVDGQTFAFFLSNTTGTTPVDLPVARGLGLPSGDFRVYVRQDELAAFVDFQRRGGPGRTLGVENVSVRTADNFDATVTETERTSGVERGAINARRTYYFENGQLGQRADQLPPGSRSLTSRGGAPGNPAGLVAGDSTPNGTLLQPDQNRPSPTADARRRPPMGPPLPPEGLGSTGAAAQGSATATSTPTGASGSGPSGSGGVTRTATATPTSTGGAGTSGAGRTATVTMTPTGGSGPAPRGGPPGATSTASATSTPTLRMSGEGGRSDGGGTATTTPTTTNTPRPSATATSTTRPVVPTATATNTTRPLPSSTNTTRPSPTATSTLRPTWTSFPTSTDEPTFTYTPRPSRTATATNLPSATATNAPTNTPRPTDTARPTDTPEPSEDITRDGSVRVRGNRIIIDGNEYQITQRTSSNGPGYTLDIIRYTDGAGETRFVTRGPLGVTEGTVGGHDVMRPWNIRRFRIIQAGN